MNEERFHADGELFRYVDADLTPEQVERFESHLAGCPACSRELAELRALLADVAAPLPDTELDVPSHVAAVMARLDEPVRKPHVLQHALFGAAAVLAAAAALALFVRGSEPGSEWDVRAPGLDAGELVARGGPRESSPSQRVGVELYAADPALRALRAGHTLRAGTPLTAGVRNVSAAPVHLLLFAVDASDTVHWIAPAYTALGTDPEATPIAPSPEERLLPTAATFDDLALGPLRVFAVMAPAEQRVSAVEGLPAAELSVDGLRKRFPAAEIHVISLQVVR